MSNQEYQETLGAIKAVLPQESWGPLRARLTFGNSLLLGERLDDVVATSGTAFAALVE